MYLYKENVALQRKRQAPRGNLNPLIQLPDETIPQNEL